MCLLQLSRSPQWTRILSISSRQFHSTLARRVLSTLHLDSKVTACRKDVHLVSLESSVCPDLASREHMVWISDARKASSSFGSNLISPRWMIPESELPKKKACKRTDVPLCPGCKKCFQVEDSWSMFEVKLLRGKKGGAAEPSPWWLQSVRSWNEMCLSGGCGLQLIVRTITLTYVYIIRMIEPPQQALFNRMFFLVEGSLNRNFRQYGQLKTRCTAQQ